MSDHELNVAIGALTRIAACAKWAGAQGHGDYRDIEADATDTLARLASRAGDAPPDDWTEWDNILNREHYFSTNDPVRVFVEKLLAERASRVPVGDAPPEGPWRVGRGFSKYGVFRDTATWTEVWLPTEAEAIVVCDALNRMARAASPVPKEKL